MIEIRAESAGDRARVRALNMAAFGRPGEADLVDALRDGCAEAVSFVAVEDGAVVGHLLFTPVTFDVGGASGMGLAPLAVAPGRQNKGIGSLLVRHGLAHLCAAGCPFVIVLGHPAYYPRFGFEPAARRKVRSQWDGVPEAAFMIAVFDAGALPAAGGVVRYRPEFDAVA